MFIAHRTASTVQRLAALCLGSTLSLTISAAPEVPNTLVEDHYCVRASSFTPGREFQQTRQLAVRFDGPPAGDLRVMLIEPAARQQLWPSQANDLGTQVLVEPFTEDLCGQEPVSTLTLTYTAEQLAEISKERGRGPGDQPTVRTVSQRATGTPSAEKGPPPNADPAARRHDWFRLYFATTRQPTGEANASKAFGSARSNEVRFGAVEVSIPHDHRWAKLESPSIFKLEWDASPDRHLMLGPTLTTLAPDAWKQELAQRAAAFGKPGVLLFVHGYNNTFEVAAQRAAQLAHDLSFGGPTVLFSWPSDGELLAYTRDEEDAHTAWRQMADVLDNLTRLGSGVKVYVVAHSMGNRVLTEGLAKLLQQRPSADQQFRQVVLAAPDVGVEEFRERWINDLKSTNAPRFTLYASGHDLPVAVSTWLHGKKRLGSGGADTPVFDGMDSIDASALTREWFGLNHSYFGDNETVLSDLFLLIHQGLPPSQRARLKKVSGNDGDYWEFLR